MSSTPVNGQPGLSAIPSHMQKKGARVIHDSSSGYNSATFEGKEAQLESVMDEIDRHGFIPENLIENETKVSLVIKLQSRNRASPCFAVL